MGRVTLVSFVEQPKVKVSGPSMIDITENKDLEHWCEKMAEQRYITLDTEFIREKTYFPIPALIQFSWQGQDPLLIDPVTISDWEPFRKILANPDIVKILHAGRQDLEIFFHEMKVMAQNVFDTQIAASMLGLGDQISYAALINKLLGVNVPKGDSFTNWLQRPLSEDQLRYARNDVRYLPDAYEKLVEKATKMKRLEWIVQETEEQLHPGLFEPDPAELWRKVKKSGTLRPKDLAVLQELASWRDKTAREANKPVRFIISDENLVELAKSDRLSDERLRSRRGIHSKFVSRYGTELLEVHSEARQKPRSDWPQAGRKPERQISESSEILADLAWLLIKEIARSSNMAPANIILKRELPQFIESYRQGLPLTGFSISKSWRKRLVGDLLVKLIEGHMILKVENHRIVWEESPQA